MDSVTAISSVVMALIWVVYLQVFLRQYLRQNRPFLVIHHAQGQDPEASCLLVNMSREPVHVQFVSVKVETEESSYTLQVTDYRRLTSEDRNVHEVLRQGPLQPGGYLVLGTFEDIILGRRSELEKADSSANSEDTADSLREVRCLEIRVAVVHGPSNFHIGARRRFLVENEGGFTSIRATNIHTEQLSGYRSRHTVRRWVESHLEPQRRGREQTQKSSQKIGG